MSPGKWNGDRCRPGPFQRRAAAGRKHSSEDREPEPVRDAGKRQTRSARGAHPFRHYSVFGCLMTLVAMINLLLWLATGIMWHVATYSKGGWDAVIILLTSIVALAELLFEHK